MPQQEPPERPGRGQRQPVIVGGGEDFHVDGDVDAGDIVERRDLAVIERNLRLP